MRNPPSFGGLFPEFRFFISLILCKCIIHQISFSCNKKKPEKIAPESAFRRYYAATEVKNMAAKGLFTRNKFLLDP